VYVFTNPFAKLQKNIDKKIIIDGACVKSFRSRDGEGAISECDSEALLMRSMSGLAHGKLWGIILLYGEK